MAMFKFFEENTEVLPEQVETGSVSDKPAKHGHGHDIEATGTEVNEATEDTSRASMSANRMTDWAIQNADRMSVARPSSVDANGHKKHIRMSSANMMSHEANKHARESMGGRLSMSYNLQMNKSTDLRSSFASQNLRPNVPGNMHR